MAETRDPFINLRLRRGRAVAHIVNPRSIHGIGKMQECRSGVIAVDLVDPTMPSRFQQRGAIQKLPQQHRAPRPVNSRQPRHNSPDRERDTLCLQKDAPSLTIRHGWRFLRHPTPIRLGINRRASGKNNTLRLEGSEKMGQTIVINGLVGLGSPFS